MAAEAAYSSDDGLAGLATGFVDLDKALGASKNRFDYFSRKTIYGKTALASNIAFNIAKSFWRPN
ncbi:MAG: hypothetical protein CM15mP29_2940 [Alphaproteobacteria bacterium]|nr:MAG: hypothetical protein CM15mP29_2940 [Alphaproteobacteria bacterium]